MWKHGNAKHTIAFAHTARRIPINHDAIMPTNTATKLNNILAKLGTADALDLRRYAISSLIMPRIWLFSTGNQIQIPIIRVMRRYLISDDGLTLTPIAQGPKPQFPQLQEDLVNKVIELASFSPDGITFDLDSYTAHGLDIGVLQLNCSTRLYYRAPDAVAQANDITLRYSSSISSTTSDNFSVLQDLTQARSFAQAKFNFPKVIFPSTKTSKSLNIDLDFQLGAPTLLSGLQINIHRLMNLLSVLPHTREHGKLRI
jgi:hypothetical protein